MRFHVGSVPLDPGFDPSPPQWTQLREPSPGLLVALATPIGGALMLVLGSLWLAMLHPAIPDSIRLRVDIGEALAVLLALVFALVAHELLHAVVLAGASEGEIVFGVWPSRLLCYAHRFGEVGRGRSIVVGLAPFFVLSLAPFALAAVLPQVAGWFVVLSLLNAAGSGADLLAIALILLGTPQRAVIRNRGFETWWRPAQQALQPDSRHLH